MNTDDGRAASAIGPRRTRRHRHGAGPAAIAAALALGGCAVLPTDEPAAPAAVGALAPGGEADRIATAELAAVIGETLEPMSTTVQVNRGLDDPAGERLAEALAAEGFGIQRVAADQGAHFLDYTRELERRETGDRVLAWRVAVGPVEARRDYAAELEDGTLSTAGPLTLAGTRAAVSPEATAQQSLRFAEPDHRRVDYVAGLDLEGPAPIISLVTPDVVERVAREAAPTPMRPLRSNESPSLQALNASQVEISNLFYGGESNFSSALDDMIRIERRIVVFPNDSMVLGDTNKRMIEAFVEERVLGDDVISLVGCSNGPTALAIGNEGLALGRARRVTEELTALGVARERIYDEGCWAPVSAGERYPGRGVVLELWRSPA